MRSTIATAIAILACAALPHPGAARPTESPDASTAYLKPSELPDPKSYLPGPPMSGTAAHDADLAGYRAALAGKGGPAWTRAIGQSRLRSPAVERQLMCAVGAKLDPTAESAYGRLLQRMALTLNDAGDRAKAQWKRDRPYAGDPDAAVCDPDARRGTPSWSYPSGHAGIGWLWGLVLSQLVPERSAELLRWGAELGDNRLVCRMHYSSDVAAGRMMGAAVYARLQADPAFRADMEAARAEIAEARKAGPPADCDGR